MDFMGASLNSQRATDCDLLGHFFVMVVGQDEKSERVGEDTVVWIVGHPASVSVQLISKFRPSRHTIPRRNQNHIGSESKIHACSST